MIQVNIIDKRAKLPKREHSTDAGIDIFCLDDFTINPGKRMLIGTGICVAIPKNHMLLLHDKSGLAVKKGIHILAGIIDEEYRGEIKVLMINLGEEDAHFAARQKICQGILLPVNYSEVKEVDKLDETLRGEGGFGSTGLC